MGRVSHVPGIRGPSSTRMRAHCPAILAGLHDLTHAMWHKGVLEPELRELVRLQVASLNHCLSCLALRYVPAKKAGLGEEKIQHLPDFESGPFTLREKCALRFASAMVGKAVDDDLFAAARGEFSEEELVDLGLWVGLQHGLGLFNLAFKADPEPFGTEISV